MPSLLNPEFRPKSSVAGDYAMEIVDHVTYLSNIRQVRTR